MALIDTRGRSLKPQVKEFSRADGDGMFVDTPQRFRFGGKQHLIALGVYPEMSLAGAR